MADMEVSSSSSEEEFVTVYQCKKCPGTRLNADEIEDHRKTHSHKRQRGSELTVFMPIENQQASNTTSGKQKRQEKERKKRQSNKNYNQNVKPRKYHTG